MDWISAGETALKRPKSKRLMSRIPIRQATSNKKNRKSNNSASSKTSTIVLSPKKSQSIKTITDSQLTVSGDDSDCEIIENITPVIVLDDECTNEIKDTSTLNETNQTNITQQIEANETVTSTTDTICDSTIKSTETTQDIFVESNQSIETEKEPELEQLFFIDKNPGTEFTAPIYEINTQPISICTENMAKNIKITFANKENHEHLDTSFAPNPLLSSTLMDLDAPMEENVTVSSSNESVTQPTNFCISINSTCDDNSSRHVSVSRKTSPVAAVSNNNNSNESRSNNNSSKGIKRKALTENHDEPPSKKNHSESSDVILVNDNLSDDDSVIFVSEDIDKRKKNRFVALDFLPLTNGKGNPKKSVS